jgi:N-ethylmaleimide reductase
MADPMLFTASALGAIPIANRVVMAPMTRNRAEADGRPTPIMTTYYTQRASAGLIIAEMTQIAATAVSYANTPGIETAEQVAGWKKVTAAVHAEGGRIVLQIAHGGRISHPSFLGGATPVAPSAIRPTGETWTSLGLVPFETPRELTPAEIMTVVQQFRVAAANARDAGFDGIELHAANGYLLDQFLRSGSNHRTDRWGGSVANRARLLVDVIEATVAEWGPGRVGVRLSPFNPYNAMHDAEPFTTFSDVAALLDTLPLAYLHINYGGGAPDDRARMQQLLRSAFHGAIIANSGLDATTGEEILASHQAEAIAFGVPFLANPDLPLRLESGAELNLPDVSTFYQGGEKGYVDYPALSATAIA